MKKEGVIEIHSERQEETREGADGRWRLQRGKSEDRGRSSGGSGSGSGAG